MIRYIVLKEKGNEVKFSIRKVDIEYSNFIANQEKIKVSLQNHGDIYLKKDWFYKTYEEAQRVSVERLISYNFKQNNKSEDGRWVCSSCGRHVEKNEVTIDHLIPILKFKKNGRYIDKQNWAMCWSEDNLTIMCTDCNSNKRSTYIKLSSIKKRKRKIKTKSFELARRDSRVLDTNVILKKKSELWQRIDEVKREYDKNRIFK